MQDRVSAWARRFIPDEDGEQPAPPSTRNQLIEMQQAARVSLRHWSKLSKRYAIGFAIFLTIALLPIWPVARDIAFAIAIVYGTLAMWRHAKVAECRAELSMHVEQFLD